MNAWVRGSLLVGTMLGALASSPPDRSWTVYGSESVREVLDRDTDRVVLDVLLTADAGALSMPAPPADEWAQVERDALLDVRIPFQSSLRLYGVAKTKGITGIGANDTDVILRVFDDTGELRAETSIFLSMAEPATISLDVPDVFARCALDQECTRAFTIEAESFERSKVKLKFDLVARIDGPFNLEAPDAARIAIDVERVQ